MHSVTNFLLYSSRCVRAFVKIYKIQEAIIRSIQFNKENTLISRIEKYSLIRAKNPSNCEVGKIVNMQRQYLTQHI